MPAGPGAQRARHAHKGVADAINAGHGPRPASHRVPSRLPTRHNYSSSRECAGAGARGGMRGGSMGIART